MSVSLVPLDLRRLVALDGDPTRLDGMPVADGALPPRFILAHAMTALREGKPAIGFALYAFVDEPHGQVAGTGGFKGPPVSGRVEIGYGVAERLRGRGIATAGVRGLLRVAFSHPELTEVYAETAVDNVASRRVVEHAGFRHVGRRVTAEDGTVDRWLTAGGADAAA